MNKRILITALSVLLLLAFASGCTSQAQLDSVSDAPISDDTVSPEPAEINTPAPAETDSPAQEQPGDEPVTDVPTHDFPIVLKCGESFSIDLDGDGSEEEIAYTPSIDGEQFPWELDSLIINGKEFKDSIYDGKFYTDCLVTDYWAITDLDSSDGALEIAIMDYGPSDDNVTYFFRYAGGELDYIGYVPGFVYDGRADSSDMSFNGVGTVDSYIRLSILQTWWAPASWTPGDESRFDLIEQDLYYPFADRLGSNVTALVPVAGYADRSSDSERSIIPAGTQLTLTATDNKEWVLAETSGGGEIWLHLNSQDGYAFEVETETGYESGAFVLDGLCMVD